jgi:hypothetical protein
MVNFLGGRINVTLTLLGVFVNHAEKEPMGAPKVIRMWVQSQPRYGILNVV